LVRGTALRTPIYLPASGGLRPAKIIFAPRFLTFLS